MIFRASAPERSGRVALVICGSIALASLALAAEVPPSTPCSDAVATRVWTNRQGVEIQAEFLGIEDGKVRLKKNDDGKTYLVPLEMLSDADQAYVQERKGAGNEVGARNWTNRLGVEIEAEFLGVEDGKVRLKAHGDGKIYLFPLETLSDADQAYVRQRAGVEPSMDPELTRLKDFFGELKRAFEDWKDARAQLVALEEPRRIAQSELMMMRDRAARLEESIQQLAIIARTVDDGGNLDRQVEIQARRQELIAMQPRIAQAGKALAFLDRQIEQHRKMQDSAARVAEQATLGWLPLCDLFGRMGAQAHRQRLPVLGDWINEEPELWQPYLARGFSRIHVGEPDKGLEDFKSAAMLLSRYDPRPSRLAFVASAQAFALSRQGESVRARAKYGEALKLDKSSSAANAIWSRICLEQGRARDAEAALRLAKQLARKGTPDYEFNVLILGEVEKLAEAKAASALAPKPQ